MGSKITFLGTGGDAIVVGKQYLACGGLLLNFSGTQLHIDPGPGSLVKAKEYGLNPRETTALLVSHNHLNHCNDINAMIAAMTHNGMDKRGVLLCNKTVYNGGEGFQSYLNNHQKDMVERAIAVVPGQKIGINDVEIEVIQVNHTDPHAIGFIITHQNYTIGIPCDTESDEVLMEELKDLDLLILNVQLPRNIKVDGLLNVESATKLLAETKPKKCIITHFGIKMLESDPRDQARQIAKASGVSVQAATDGYVHELDGLL